MDFCGFRTSEAEAFNMLWVAVTAGWSRGSRVNNAFSADDAMGVFKIC